MRYKTCRHYIARKRWVRMYKWLISYTSVMRSPVARMLHVVAMKYSAVRLSLGVPETLSSFRRCYVQRIFIPGTSVPRCVSYSCTRRISPVAKHGTSTWKGAEDGPFYGRGREQQHTMATDRQLKVRALSRPRSDHECLCSTLLVRGYMQAT